MIFDVTNIKWDSEGEFIEPDMQIEIPDEELAEMDKDEIEERISDELSNQSGYCHFGFQILTKL